MHSLCGSAQRTEVYNGEKVSELPSIHVQLAIECIFCKSIATIIAAFARSAPRVEGNVFDQAPRSKRIDWRQVMQASEDVEAMLMRRRCRARDFTSQ